MDKLDHLFTVVSQKQFETRFGGQQYIGRGSGSKILSAFDYTSDIFVAIKHYNNAQLASPQDIQRQIIILDFINNLNIECALGYYGALKVVSADNRKVSYCIILQKCECSLDQFIKSQKFFQMNMREKIQLFLKITKQINMLHQYNIIHRDLKPANILLGYRNQCLVPLIADFGHSKQLSHNIQNTSMRGSIKYVNPLLIQQNNYGLQWDIYSLGLILGEIITGEFLLNISQQINSQIKYIKTIREDLKDPAKILKRFPLLQQSLRQLIYECLTNKNLQISQLVKKVQYQLKVQMVKQSSIMHNTSLKKQKLNSSTIQTKSLKQQVFINEQRSSDIAIQQAQNKLDTKSQSLQENSKIEIIKQLKQNKINSQIQYNSKIQSDHKPIKELQKKSSLGSQGQSAKNNPKKQRKAYQFSSKIKNNNKLNFLCKIIATQHLIQKEYKQCQETEKQLQKLRIYQQKFKNLKTIESVSIEDKDKKKLLIIALRYIVAQMKQSISSSSKSFQKYGSKFVESINSIQQKLFQDYRRTQWQKLNISTQNFLQKQRKVHQLKQQFIKSLKNLGNPTVFSLLQHTLN